PIEALGRRFDALADGALPYPGPRPVDPTCGSERKRVSVAVFADRGPVGARRAQQAGPRSCGAQLPGFHSGGCGILRGLGAILSSERPHPVDLRQQRHRELHRVPDPIVLYRCPCLCRDNGHDHSSTARSLRSEAPTPLAAMLSFLRPVRIDSWGLSIGKSQPPRCHGGSSIGKYILRSSKARNPHGMVGSALRHWVDCGQPGATSEIYAVIGHRVGHPTHCIQCEWDHAGARRQVPPRQGAGRRRLKYSLFLTGPLSRFHPNRERVWADIAGPWDSRSLPVGGFYRLGLYSTNRTSKRSLELRATAGLVHCWLLLCHWSHWHWFVHFHPPNLSAALDYGMDCSSKGQANFCVPGS